MKMYQESSQPQGIPGASFWAALSAQTKSCHHSENGEVQVWLPENISRWPGEYSMIEISDSPKIGSESTPLSSILENLDDWLTRHPGSTADDFSLYLERYHLSLTAVS